MGIERIGPGIAIVEGSVVTVVVCDVTPEGPFQSTVTSCLVPCARFGTITVLTPDGWYTVMVDGGESVPETETSAVVVPTGDLITNDPVVLVSAVDDTIDGLLAVGVGTDSKLHCG